MLQKHWQSFFVEQKMIVHFSSWLGQSKLLLSFLSSSEFLLPVFRIELFVDLVILVGLSPLIQALPGSNRLNHLEVIKNLVKMRKMAHLIKYHQEQLQHQNLEMKFMVLILHLVRRIRELLRHILLHYLRNSFKVILIFILARKLPWHPLLRLQLKTPSILLLFHSYQRLHHLQEFLRIFKDKKMLLQAPSLNLEPSYVLSAIHSAPSVYN